MLKAKIDVILNSGQVETVIEELLALNWKILIDNFNSTVDRQQISGLYTLSMFLNDNWQVLYHKRVH